jgi:Flp pilus assembly protein TadG
VRNLIRNRRGVSAFATVIALTPLIGVMALGAEAGSWYVTKQHAQNAADAAAYSGGLALACTLSGSSCTDAHGYAYRGKEFAAQNNFCNAGDSSYPGANCAASLPSGTSQSVTIDRGTWASGVWTTSAGGAYVRATVQQTQPTYLASVLGQSSVTIGGQAIARVNALAKPPCALALTGSLSFQGSANINTPNCSLASNDTAANALSFTGSGNSVNVGSLSAAGGCTGSPTYCDATYTRTYMPPVTNPFSNLDSDLSKLCGANPTLPATCGLSTKGACAISKKNPTPIAYTAATPCANDNVTTNGNAAVPLSAGVYFISGTLTLTGGSSITGTGVTFILLPGATINTNGGGTLTLTGSTSAPASTLLPAAFTSDAGLFQNMALYDASSSAVQFGGNSNINITGNIYAPTAAVTFQGNPTLNLSGGNACGELIAASIAFNGNATFNDAGTGCGASETPNAQYVQLVQ